MKYRIGITIWCVVGVIVLVCIINTQLRPATSTKSVPVVAQTWGWAKLVSEPVSVISKEDELKGQDNIGLMQVEFQMSDVETLTAFVNAGHVTGMLDPHPKAGNRWNIGDEVLIVIISGKSSGGALGSRPSVTYVVTDYRSKQTAR